MAAPVWARIWFEPAADEGQTNLVWRVVESGVLSPSYLRLSLRNASGSNVATFGATAADGETVAFAFDAAGEDIPVASDVFVSLPYEHAVEGFSPTVLEARMQLDPEAHTRADPLLVRCPFDLWPVRLFGEAELFVMEAKQTLALDPYRNSDLTSLEIVSSSFAHKNELSSFYLPAPQQGTAIGVEADVYDAQGEKRQVITEVPGPGVYMAGAQGLRLATEAELSMILRADGCGAPGKPCCMDDPVCQDGALCVDDTCQSDCGGVGSACCGGPDGACAAGAHCTGEVCEACGTLGETCCGGVGGDCDATSICSDEGVCEPCGGDGQPCCGGGACDGAACVDGVCRADCGAAGGTCCGGYGGACEAGAYCPSSQQQCVACGEAGQQCCGGFGGTCNPGAYCPSNQQQCVACGQPGQACCGGFGGTCVQGAYCPSNQKQCVACGQVGQVCCGGYDGTCESGAHCTGSHCVAD